MSDVADEGRDAAIERCGKQPKRNCFFTITSYSPWSLPWQFVNLNEPIRVRQSFCVLVVGYSAYSHRSDRSDRQATSGAMQIFSPGHVFYEELW